jgi:hypothetical protein
MKSKTKSKKKNQLFNEPHIEFITDRNVRIVTKFEVDFECNKECYSFTIPEGFITDGASIPDIFWGFPFYFTPFQGKTLPAAVVHDYFYSNKIPDKKLADWCFLQLLKKYKVGYFKRSMYYLAVHLFGRYN